MNDKQKFLAIAAGALVVGSALGFVFNGFSKDTPAPAAPPAQQQTQQTQQTQGSQQQAGTKAPAAPVDTTAIIANINAFVDEEFKGDWKVEGDKLYKGDYLENGNYKIADGLETKLGPGSMISIFAGEKRISTTVKMNGTDRVFDYEVKPEVGQALKSGKEITGSSDFGATIFLPLKDKDGKAVGVIYVIGAK